MTIVAESSSAADALSTIVFVAGLEKGLAFVRACPGTEAVLVDMASQVYLKPGLTDCFQAAAAVGAIVV